MLRLHIQNYKDRENLVVALANAGYAVRVKEQQNLIGSNYFVELLDFEGKEINKDSALEKFINM